MVVPKKPQTGQPPRRRLYVDYGALNNLLAPVTKEHFKAKGVLTLAPLPKIEDVYARCNGLCMPSTSDMRSGYHYIKLSKESQPKLAFLTPVAKFEFTHATFELT